MLHPESSGALVGTGQGLGVAFGMGEKGRVEVTAHATRLAKFHPFGKMLGLELVAIDPTAVFLIKNGIAGVKIELYRAGHERDDLINILHQLRGSGCLARVIARGLNTARKALFFLLSR